MTAAPRKEDARSEYSVTAAINGRARRLEVRQSDVARAAGVSQMTVSRVMNGSTNVHPSIRESVNAAIRELGYTPDPLARSLARARFERIAVLHDDPRSAALGRLLIGVLEQSNRIGAQTVMREIAPRGHSATRTIRALLDDGVAGVILPPGLGGTCTLLDALCAVSLPVVAVCASAPHPDVMCVGIDDRRAAFDMTRHLLALGHRRIGFIRGPLSQEASEERWRGFLEAMRQDDAGPAQIQMAQGQGTYRSGVEAAKCLLDAWPAPTAIFASGDDMAAAAIMVAHHRGYQVPEKLTVVGFDDGVAACGLWPELTTIRQPMSKMGIVAVKMLIGAIRSGGPVAKPAQRKMLIGHRLLLRASAASPN